MNRANKPANALKNDYVLITQKEICGVTLSHTSFILTKPKIKVPGLISFGKHYIPFYLVVEPNDILVVVLLLPEQLFSKLLIDT